MLDTIINFKGSPELKKAIQNVAFADPDNNSKQSSEWLRKKVEADPLIKKELEKIQSSK